MKQRPKNDPVDIRNIFDGIRERMAEEIDEMEHFFRSETTGEDGIQICLSVDPESKEPNIGFLLGDQDITVSIDEFLDHTELVWNDSEIDWSGLINALSVFRDKINVRIENARIQETNQETEA